MKIGVKLQYQLDRAKRLGVTVPDDQIRWGAEHVRGWLDAEERMRAQPGYETPPGDLMRG